MAPSDRGVTAHLDVDLSSAARPADDLTSQIGQECLEASELSLPVRTSDAVRHQRLGEDDVVGEELVPGVRMRAPPSAVEALDAGALGGGIDSWTLSITDTHSIYCTVGCVDVKPQRLDYVEQTRSALVVAAEALFIERGYQATSIDAIGAAARFTKGAVYRHFADKRSLFLAVFEQVEADVVAELGERADAAPDPLTAARTALSGFLELASADRFRRIVLEEGPGALGWRRWRELDHQHTAALLERLLIALIDANVIADVPVAPLARMCCAVIGEAAIQLLDSENEEAHREVLAALEALLVPLGSQVRVRHPVDLA